MSESDGEIAVSSHERVLKREIKELKQKLDEQIAYSESLKILTSKSIDLVKAGIGGNYGGSYYNDALDKYYYPLVSALENSPTQSLSNLKADAVREYELQAFSEDVWIDRDVLKFDVNAYADQLIKESKQ